MCLFNLAFHVICQVEIGGKVTKRFCSHCESNTASGTHFGLITTNSGCCSTVNNPNYRDSFNPCHQNQSAPLLCTRVCIEEVAFDPALTMEALQSLSRPRSPSRSPDSLPKPTTGIYASSRGVSGICTRLCLHRMFKLDAD